MVSLSSQILLHTPSLAMPLHLPASTQIQAGDAAECMGLCCVFYIVLHTGTRCWAVTWLLYHYQRDTDQRWNMCWVKSFRQTSPISPLLFLHLTELIYELMTTILCLKWSALIYHLCEQNMALKITHRLGHKVVCWGMNEYFMPFCSWDTVVLWVWLLGELVLISCSLHDPENILSSLTHWTPITSVWSRNWS